MLVQPASKQKSVFVKYFVSNSNGIQLQNSLRAGIGYVISGTKYIYDDDARLEVAAGDMFYLGVGNHYIEDVPDDKNRFEQIMLHYNTEQLSWLVQQMNLNYGLSISNICETRRGRQEIKYQAWDTVRFLFRSINLYIEHNLFSHDEAAISIKMTELVYLLFTDPECCLLCRILEDTNPHGENFEQVVRENIFSDMSLEELAAKCGCSLTHFKKEFDHTFHDAPHQWIIKQRLTHARLLLISTDRSISEICELCGFHNTSHFIKTFKREYGLTPAHYRSRYNNGAEATTRAARTKPSKQPAGTQRGRRAG